MSTDQNEHPPPCGCYCERDRDGAITIYLPPSPTALEELTDEPLEDVLKELDYYERSPGVWVKLPEWVLCVRGAIGWVCGKRKTPTERG